MGTLLWVGGTVLFLVVGLVPAMRKPSALKRLSEYDDGTRCVGCDSLKVELRAGAVACIDCGYATTLESLKNSRLSKREIRIANDTDGRPLMGGGAFFRRPPE